MRGYAILAQSGSLPALAALGNSTVFDFLFKVMLGRFGFPEFIVGVLQRLPTPQLSVDDTDALSRLAHAAIDSRHAIDAGNELSHVFKMPPLLQASGRTLVERSDSWARQVEEMKRRLTDYRRQIDDACFRLYRVDGDERAAIEDTLHLPGEEESVEERADEIEAVSLPEVTDTGSLVCELISYTVGCAVGRWDVRLTTGARAIPDLPDPFAPLQVYSPGMLTEEPRNYPITIDRDGILPDDADHPDDIVRRVHEVFALIWGERAEAIEQEACAILGVKELREYFRKPAAGGFWADHVARYSKSHRKAPIYWLVQSARKNFAIWLYYHRLDSDTLSKALINYVEPKLRLEDNRLHELRSKRMGARYCQRQRRPRLGPPNRALGRPPQRTQRFRRQTPPRHRLSPHPRPQ